MSTPIKQTLEALEVVLKQLRRGADTGIQAAFADEGLAYLARLRAWRPSEDAEMVSRASTAVCCARNEWREHSGDVDDWIARAVLRLLEEEMGP